jgi:hypothetical protein
VGAWRQEPSAQRASRQEEVDAALRPKVLETPMFRVHARSGPGGRGW